jgi:hypothetical protein
MNKIITISVFMVLLASYAWSQPNYSTTQTQTSFDANICVPINILDPGTIHLGDIAPGVSKTLDAETYRMQFQITGCNNWKIQVSGSVDANGDQNDCLLTYNWQYYNGAWNVGGDFPWILYLNNTGNAYVSVWPLSVTATAGAAEVTRSFQITLDASYQNM